MKQELIQLDRTEVKVSADSLPTVIPEGSPRYHFYRFEHTHEGDYQEAIGKPQAHHAARCIIYSVTFFLQYSFTRVRALSLPLRRGCSTLPVKNH